MTPQTSLLPAIELKEMYRTEPDCIDMASEQSFPAKRSTVLDIQRYSHSGRR